jgi:hypothetical protein
MFKTPEDIARAALELLDSPLAGVQAPTLLASIELGAVTIANHVWDWHEKTGKPPLDKAAFAAVFPDWDLLRQISNGFKHAKARPDISKAQTRAIEWEDDDFWYSTHGRDVLFVEIDGKMRAVSAIVRAFVREYTK